MSTTFKSDAQASQMTDKQLAYKIIEQLPGDATLSLIREEIALPIELEEGVRDIEEGRLTSHEEVVRRSKSVTNTENSPATIDNTRCPDAEPQTEKQELTHSFNPWERTRP